MKKLYYVLFLVLLLTLMPKLQLNAANYVEYQFKDNNQSSYSNYLDANKGQKDGIETIKIPAKSYQLASDVTTENKRITIAEGGSVTYQFKIKEAGLYNIELDYCTVPGRGTDLITSLKIDGKTPFDQAQTITLKRIWKNKNDIETADNGNEIVPEQVEVNGCSSVLLEDSNRIVGEPFKFYLSAGEHKLTLQMVEEPLSIEQIIIKPPLQTPSYSEYLNSEYEQTSNQRVIVEGEAADLKSSKQLAPLVNFNDANVSPNDPYVQKVNVIGGTRWSMPGDYLEWTINVPDSGLYNIAINAQQNFEQDLYATRRLSINGTIPFKEANNLKFVYNKNFQTYTLSDEQGTPYQFYFDSGYNTLRLENVSGELGNVAYQLNQASKILNEIYRDVIMITGTEPDKYRTYKLDENIDYLTDNLEALVTNLQQAQEQIISVSTSKGNVTATIDKLILQLQRFIDEPDNIARELSSFRGNISALPATVRNITNQKLTIDSIELTSPNISPSNKNSSFGSSFTFAVNRFFASFTSDLNTSVGAKVSDGTTIEVWITRGQDEMQAWRRVIDNFFTPQTGINVELKLVSVSALLPAVLAGDGPDVAMFLSQDVPVNYAMRDALEDLSTYPGYDQVANRFYPSAITPFEYNGGVYALPEEQKFPIMLYRKDIFKQLNLSVPKTWEQLFAILPILNANNMELMLEPTLISGLGQVNPNLIFSTLLYQNGGSYYKDGDKQSALTDEEAIKAFNLYCKFYTNYSVDITADFSNRFKTGEVPIGIMDYTQYNQINLFAPELAGNIGVARVPATRQDDGSLNQSVASLTNGMVMFKDSTQKDAAWEFMKWATSASAQQQFASELEARVGIGGRWQSANVQALTNSSYPTRDLTQILKQQATTVGVRQVPGGYISAREEENAFKAVVNEQANPTETMFEHVLKINQELTIKRKEFGLDYIDSEVVLDDAENKE